MDADIPIILRLKLPGTSLGELNKTPTAMAIPTLRFWFRTAITIGITAAVKSNNALVKLALFKNPTNKLK